MEREICADRETWGHIRTCDRTNKRSADLSSLPPQPIDLDSTRCVFRARLNGEHS